MFTLPELPYPYNALEPYIDEETMHLHHDKHHASYVKNLNDALSGHEEFLNMDTLDLLKNLDLVPEDIRTKVRNNGGGHANHSLFWTIMKPGGGKEPSGELAKAIADTFTSFENFKEEVTKKALGIFGSGWGWLVLDNGKLEIITTPNQDSPLMQNKTPLLGIDVWEHSYYLKYKNCRDEYISAWWNVTNWAEVERRFEEASK